MNAVGDDPILREYMDAHSAIEQTHNPTAEQWARFDRAEKAAKDHLSEPETRTMKSNEELGFVAVHPITPLGRPADGDSGTTTHVVVGKREETYRGYAYLRKPALENERPGYGGHPAYIYKELCTRGLSAMVVLANMQSLIADQWQPVDARAGRRAIMEIEDVLAEDAPAEDANLIQILNGIQHLRRALG